MHPTTFSIFAPIRFLQFELSLTTYETVATSAISRYDLITMDLGTLLAGIPAALDCGKKVVELVKGAKELAPKESHESGALTEALSGLLDLQFKLMETQGMMLEAQRIVNATEQRAADAERKLAQHDEWKAEAAKYELHEPFAGTFVYRSLSAPFHFICPAGYAKRSIHILQGSGSFKRCVECGEVGYQFGYAETGHWSG